MILIILLLRLILWTNLKKENNRRILMGSKIFNQAIRTSRVWLTKGLRSKSLSINNSSTSWTKKIFCFLGLIKFRKKNQNIPWDNLSGSISMRVGLLTSPTTKFNLSMLLSLCMGLQEMKLIGSLSNIKWKVNRDGLTSSFLVLTASTKKEGHITVLWMTSVN